MAEAESAVEAPPPGRASSQKARFSAEAQAEEPQAAASTRHIRHMGKSRTGILRRDRLRKGFKAAHDEHNANYGFSTNADGEQVLSKKQKEELQDAEDGDESAEREIARKLWQHHRLVPPTHSWKTRWDTTMHVRPTPLPPHATAGPARAEEHPH